MGIRLNGITNALTPLRTEGVQTRAPAQPLPGSPQPMGGVTQPSLGATESIDGRPLAPPLPNSMNEPATPFTAAPDEGGETPPPQPLEAAVAAGGQVDGLQETANRPAARIRAFRFLMAAGSGHGRELEARYNQLERRLSTVNARLELANSIMVQIDARLERARLQQDLDVVASEIRRMRLDQVFQAPPPPVVETAEPEPPAEPPQPAPAASEAFAPTRQPVLNLLA